MLCLYTTVLTSLKLILLCNEELILTTFIVFVLLLLIQYPESSPCPIVKRNILYLVLRRKVELI